MIETVPAVLRFFGSFLKRFSQHSVTQAGLVFSLSILLVGIAAAASGNNLLFLVLAAMISTLMVSGLISRLSLSGLELDFVLPEHITARRKAIGRLYIRNTKRWVPSFSVHLNGSEENVLTTLYFPVVPGGATLDETIEVCFPRRGIYRESGFLFTTGFPFGFVQYRAHVTLRRDVLVYPSILPQPGFEELLAAVRGDLETQQRGRGHDFHRIRPYEALESARHVDWKASAKVGSLQVREFAREQERLLEIFLDLNVPLGRDEWFERAVDACAFLSWHMASQEARLRFLTQEIDISVPETGDVYTILRYLATVSPASIRHRVSPGGETSCKIVFTARREDAFAEAGWSQARFIRPDALGGGSESSLGV